MSNISRSSNSSASSNLTNDSSVSNHNHHHINTDRNNIIRNYNNNHHHRPTGSVGSSATDISSVYSGSQAAAAIDQDDFTRPNYHPYRR